MLNVFHLLFAPVREESEEQSQAKGDAQGGIRMALDQPVGGFGHGHGALPDIMPEMSAFSHGGSQVLAGGGGLFGGDMDRDGQQLPQVLHQVSGRFGEFVHCGIFFHNELAVQIKSMVSMVQFFAAMNHLQNDQNDGGKQEEMNKAAQQIVGNPPQQPDDDQNDGKNVQHITLGWLASSCRPTVSLPPAGQMESGRRLRNGFLIARQIWFITTNSNKY